MTNQRGTDVTAQTEILARLTDQDRLSACTPGDLVTLLWDGWRQVGRATGASGTTWVLQRQRAWVLFTLPCQAEQTRPGLLRRSRTVDWDQMTVQTRTRVAATALDTAQGGAFFDAFNDACQLARRERLTALTDDAGTGPDPSPSAALVDALVTAQHGHDRQTLRLLAARRGIDAA